MLKKFKIKFKIKFKNKSEIMALGLLLFITIISTTYYNHTKNKILNNYKILINNVYLKKTANHFFNNLEPRFKKINHKIQAGETFDKILELNSVREQEIKEIKKKLSKKIDLNKLSTNHKIQFTIDQSNNLIKDFVFQISNTERILLTRNLEKGEFDQEIILTKLNKDIIYSENIILQSLYKSATSKKIPINVIIEFARIYGFQVDFQRDIRKQDRFQIMYEVFIDDNKKIIETGNILFANLILSGQDNPLYYLI